MNIKERRMLNKIYRTHHQLLQRLNLGDDDYWKVVRRFTDYHNELNNKILQMENAKNKSKSV